MTRAPSAVAPCATSAARARSDGIDDADVGEHLERRRVQLLQVFPREDGQTPGRADGVGEGLRHRRALHFVRWCPLGRTARRRPSPRVAALASVPVASPTRDGQLARLEQRLQIGAADLQHRRRRAAAAVHDLRREHTPGRRSTCNSVASAHGGTAPGRYPVSSRTSRLRASRTCTAPASRASASTSTVASPVTSASTGRVVVQDEEQRLDHVPDGHAQRLRRQLCRAGRGREVDDLVRHASGGQIVMDVREGSHARRLLVGGASLARCGAPPPARVPSMDGPDRPQRGDAAGRRRARRKIPLAAARRRPAAHRRRAGAGLSLLVGGLRPGPAVAPRLHLPAAERGVRPGHQRQRRHATARRLRRGARASPGRALRARRSSPATRSAGCASRASTSTGWSSRASADGRASIQTGTARCSAADRSTTRSRRCREPANPSPSPATAPPIGAPFYKLDKLRKGDPIFVDTPYARFRYAVAKTTTVDPTDVGVLSDRGYGLVLTTCTPPYSAAHRLIVWATLEKAKPLQKALGR